MRSLCGGTLGQHANTRGDEVLKKTAPSKSRLMGLSLYSFRGPNAGTTVAVARAARSIGWASSSGSGDPRGAMGLNRRTGFIRNPQSSSTANVIPATNDIVQEFADMLDHRAGVTDSTISRTRRTIRRRWEGEATGFVKAAAGVSVRSGGGERRRGSVIGTASLNKASLQSVLRFPRRGGRRIPFFVSVRATGA
jgi:hypothetical protein